MGFLHPGFVTRERSRKDDPRAVPCFYLGPAPNHPSGTVRVLTKDTRSIVSTRDVTWLDMKDARAGIQQGGNQSAAEALLTKNEGAIGSNFISDGSGSSSDQMTISENDSDSDNGDDVGDWVNQFPPNQTIFWQESDGGCLDGEVDVSPSFPHRASD